MSVLSITCDNCGAKYRLPESFSSDKAKCKKCQSVIDVAAQRNKPKEEAGGERKPAAAARPARARPAAASKPAAERAQPSASRRSGGSSQRRRAAADDDKGASGSRRRGRRDAKDEQPKKNNSMLLWGGVAALVVIGVVVALMWPEDKKTTPNTEEVAQNNGQAAANQNNESTKKPEPPAADANSTAQAGKPADAAESGSGEGGGSSEAAETPAASGDKPAEEPTADAAEDKQAEPAAAKPKATESSGLSESPNDGNTERWMRNKTSSMAEVLDTKTLGDVTWPESATPEIKVEVYELLDSVSDGGLAGIRAKPKLEKIGYFAIFGIIDRLRKLNYTDADDNMTAWELNKVLESITAGLNTGFAAVNVGEDLDPRKADYNAKTTKAWTKLIDNPQLADEKSFDAWRKKRLQKK